MPVNISCDRCGDPISAEYFLDTKDRSETNAPTLCPECSTELRHFRMELKARLREESDAKYRQAHAEWISIKIQRHASTESNPEISPGEET